MMNKSITKMLYLTSIFIAFLSVCFYLNSTPKSGEVVWKFKIGSQFWGPLKYDQGILYFGCDDMNFYAFNPAIQQIKWKFKTGGIIRSAPDISGGLAVFASDDGFLYALDVNSGNELWRFSLQSSAIARRLPAPDPPYEYDYLQSSPVYHNGVIYIGSANGMLYAIDHKSGKELWHFKTNQRIRSTPAVYKNNIYFGSWDGNVYAVSIKSGREIWQFDCGGIIQSSPAVGAGNIFIGSRSAKIFALNAETGEQKWVFNHKDGSWVESSPVFDKGIVYIGSSDALKLWAFDATTGEIIWVFKTGGWSWGKPAIANGVVYIGSISAYPYYFEGVDLKAGFYAVDEVTGKKLWNITPDTVKGYITGGVFSKAEVADGIIYIGSIDGYLYAVKE
jgi:eukaryotic-like serine/threonine-protein kinase